MNKGLKRKIRKRHRIIEEALIKNSTRVTKVKYNGKVYKINAVKYIDAMRPVRDSTWLLKIIISLRCNYDA